MNYMIGKLKDCNKYIENTNENEVNLMYQEGSGHILGLTNNPRSECFSWHTHVCHVNKDIRKQRSSLTTN